MNQEVLNQTDRDLLNMLQAGIPVAPRPYAACAAKLGMSEEQVVKRINDMLADGLLTRFGPMFNVEKMGGEFTLVAAKVPADRFEEVSAQVNSFTGVAHNYEREHELNMWFVTATGTKAQTEDLLRDISEKTGLKLFAMPKEKEFFLEMKLKL
jgi:DNA-binding Lrp family transcriptional regulator